MEARKLPIAITGILLLISVCGSIAIFQYSTSYYRSLQDARLDPKGLRYFVNEPLPIESGKPTVVFFGDSRAAQWPTPDTADFHFINRGIGAQTSTQVMLRYQDHVTPLQPDILIVQVGINDLKTIPIFPDRKREIIESCKANIRLIVEQAVADDVTVILTTIFPIGTVPLIRQPFWSPDVGLAVQEVNSFLFALQGSNVQLMDSYAILSVENQTQNRYQMDTLHLNRTGYAALNSFLLELLDLSIDN